MASEQRSRTRIVTALVPVTFVLLWSSGFIAAKAAVGGAEPLTLLALRYAIVTFLMAVVVAISAAPWPRTARDAVHIVAAGLFMQVVYFGAAWVSMAAGVGAGVNAVIVCAYPVITAIAAGPILGERINPRQWAGFALGALGVVLVVWNKLELGLGTPAGMAWSFVSLAGITVGTLYQKRYCAAMDPRTGGLIQFTVTAIVIGALALVFEDGRIAWTWEVILGLGYVAIVTSLVSITLLLAMIRRGELARVASVFFLVPPSAALIAYLVLGETFAPIALAGMGLTAVGVALVVSPRRVATGAG
ncbi:MAG: DMT family transporter [Alphaproteobacteria bacterium]|nr:DMT family transporter [Alphaproteobacteria bacterium]